MGEMDDIVREFLVESNEGLDQLDQDLVQLEIEPNAKDLLARVFRTVHTIKGTSGVLGFDIIASISHIGENLLSRLRDGKLSLSSARVNALLAMIDALRTLLLNIANTGSEGNERYLEVIEQLKGVLDGEIAAAPKVVAGGLELGDTKDNERILENTSRKRGNSRKPRVPKKAAKRPAARDASALPEEPNNDGQPLSGIESMPESGREQADHRNVDVSSSTIRVDVSLLDKLMTLVGELVLARNQVLQFTTAQQDSRFSGTAQRLNLITTELQAGVMKTRMQPLGNVWNKFPRIIRDLSASCGKRVSLEMIGSETELDKTIIEAVKDPLTHILRNSIDHGIETPEERVLAGKAETGHLLLRAFHEGGQVNIEISDDGAGINPEKVKRKALERGLVSVEQAARMSEKELLGLVFLPGLSTAQKVTNISGRGVGMDVVKTNLERIGGAVDLQSTVGRGTTLKIKIPLTLAIIPALVVTSGGERFAIPQVSLVELVRNESCDSRSVEHVHGAPVYRLRGRLLPLVYLNDRLKLKSEKINDVVNIVVLQADGREFGLVVDEINDTQEIVVKPLGNQLKGITCFAGATIMGDGRVALIVDVLGMAQLADITTESQNRVSSTSDELGPEFTRPDAQAKDSWLIFRIGSDRRLAVPLSQVSRLEKIPASTVERSATQKVIQYRGEIIPIISLSELVDSQTPCGESDLLQAIVYTSEGRSYALLVDDIVDIVEENISCEGSVGNDEMLLGAAVIQKRVTDLLNLNYLARKVDVSVKASVLA